MSGTTTYKDGTVIHHPDIPPLVITRPFAVFVEPDGNGGWVAHVVGHELDNCTQGDSPDHAMEMVADMLRLLMEKDK